jgi:hypothetical protein
MAGAYTMKAWEVYNERGNSSSRETVYADWLDVSNGALHFQTELEKDGPSEKIGQWYGTA